jgi:hypothetical protein
MQALRSIPPSFKRPTIHEIITSILTPSRVCQARHSHTITKRLFPPPLRSSQLRRIHTTRAGAISRASHPPKSHDRGPSSTESTQTDFSALDVLGGAPVPSTSIDACLWDGFHLNSGVKVTGGAGVLLVGGEAFCWRPWNARGMGARNLLNAKGQWEVVGEAWGALELVWPRPGTYTCFKSFVAELKSAEVWVMMAKMHLS